MVMLWMRRSRWLNKLFVWFMALLHFRVLNALLCKTSRSSTAGTTSSSTALRRAPLASRRPYGIFAPRAVFSLGGAVEDDVSLCPALRISGACDGHSLSRPPSPAQRRRVSLSLRRKRSLSLHAMPTDTAAETALDTPQERERARKSAYSPRELALVAVGLTHRLARVEQRERLAVPESDWHDVAVSLTSCAGVAEAAVLSTCNRFELYLSGHDEAAVERDALQFLEDRAWSAWQREKEREKEKKNKSENESESEDEEKDKKSERETEKATESESEAEAAERAALREELRSSLFVLRGDEAAAHLLRVSSGLDSLVLGEGQILAQVKKAAEHATERESPAGKVVAKLLNKAVSAGKRVRCETDIARGAVSVSSAAAQFSASRVESETGKRELGECRVTVLGAGAMARLLLVHLQSQGVARATIANRTPQRVAALQSECPKTALEHVPLEDEDALFNALCETDVLYACTASTEPLISPALLEKVMQRRRERDGESESKGGLHVVDISVPRNVHADCAKVDNVFVYNVDDLQSVIDANTEKRRAAMLHAERILSDELLEFRDWQSAQGAVETIKKLQEMAEQTRQSEVQRSFKKLSLPPEAAQAIEGLTKSLVKRLLDCPIKRLREGNACRASIEKAFNLD